MNEITHVVNCLRLCLPVSFCLCFSLSSGPSCRDYGKVDNCLGLMNAAR